ncbi:hypothetical protein LOTGIDRAFT_166957 [Lottia gigantea]|uniref:Apple domain-containing protein n=1 Tax=Lottia gigantea TaxID=225164 RepID=V4BDJ0_LOTGI|nr:hypothetical protein LOTGIDRAFT_166957 [Lottia gigantea]ESO86684.1 hypothetical protein LOTGIDRAFT_166957 [Lottia gigantea]
MKVAFVLLVMVVYAHGGKQKQRDFMMYRYKPMDGYMPPLEPISFIPDKMTCALHCLDDVTCGSLSYSNVTEMCQLSDEIWTYKEISIAHFNGHFYHYNLYEMLQKNTISLPHGYRWHPDLGVALRYHFLRRLNSSNAEDYCNGEGGSLVSIDMQNKTDTIQNALTNNRKLMREDLPFMVKLTNQTESEEVVDGSGDCRAINKLGTNYTFTALPCDYKIPYICEITASTLGISTFGFLP